ncbi:MAG: hypothetical protein KAI17_05325 [Thiotrichaceae bacterium]|nr:hypothetical protein [Thiotrichaceae bacterium]
MSIRFFMLILMLGSLSACGGGTQLGNAAGSYLVGSEFFKQGETTATATALSAWENLGKSCQQVDAFIGLMEKSTDDATSQYKGKSVEEFGSGYLSGLSKVVKTIRSQCPNQSSKLDQLEQTIKDKL